MHLRRRSFLTAAALPWLAHAAGARPVQIVGERHQLLRFDDGRVIGWGAAGDGQLGLPSELKLLRLSLPQPVAFALPGPATSIAAGDRASIAALADGSVVAWGSGPLLGQSDFSGPPLPPQRLPGLERVVQVVAQEHQALARLDDGRVLAWGDRRPLAPVAGVDGVRQLSWGAGAALALREDGRVIGWGSNRFGALGRPPRREDPLPDVGEVQGLADVLQVVAGSGVGSALTADGRVWVWGANWHAQFGNGDRTDPPGMTHGWDLVPRPVAGVDGVSAIALGLTGRHTLALRRDGTLRGWGNSDWGQIGAGVTGDFQPRPVKPRIDGVAAVFAAGNHSYALRRDGSFWAWGAGERRHWPLEANTAVPVAVALP